MTLTPEQARGLRARFAAAVALGFAAAPAIGVGAALLAGVVAAPVAPVSAGAWLAVAALAAFPALAGVAAWRYAAPFVGALAGASEATWADRRLAAFPRRYWLLQLAYAMAVVLTAARLAWGDAAAPAGRLLHLAILQLSGAIVAGLPAFVVAQDTLGRIAAAVGLVRPSASLRSRLVVVGALLPQLGYTLLAELHFLRTGTLPPALLAAWAALAALTLLTAWLAIRGLARALRPVQRVLGGTGAAAHGELAALRPVSADEVGYLTQTLGRVFGRLRDHEAYMRAVVDTAAEGVIVVDEEGAIETFNRAAERLFGFRAAEVRGRALAWLLPELVREGEAPALGERETEAAHRSGRRIPVSVRVSDMEVGGRRRYTCLVADISERRAAEDELRRAEARYRDLVETAHDLVWSVDAEGRWLYLNRACKSIYGYEPEEMVGRPVADFEDPEFAERDAQAFASLLAGQELVQYEAVHLDREGKRRHLSFNGRAHRDADGRVIYATGTARDVTERKAFEARLTYYAEHDSLTGLFNRHYFQQELERVVARVARSRERCALLYIDLDQFKYVNDTLGHGAGDRLLVEVARMLRAHVREGDLLARFGGDEFTVLLYDIDPRHAVPAAEHLRALFEGYRFVEAGSAFNVSCSIGVAIVDAGTASADEALSHADLACNVAKAGGRNRVHLYDPADPEKAGMAADMGWAARVREMLEHDRFRLVFQPIVSVRSGEVHDYEVLMRMVCDDGQVILPGGFMPAAERFGLIHAVDRWMVRHAIGRLAELRAGGADVRFSINLSGKAFEDEELLPLIRRELRRTGLDPQLLTFEITETAAIANLSAALRFIRALKEIGCQFALDDFGSGFCSFTYLKHLPVDKLKIDGSFVQGLARARVDQEMVRSINQIAHALGKQTIAEYVEDARTLELLREFGVDYAQGNFLGRPDERIPPQARAARA